MNKIASIGFLSLFLLFSVFLSSSAHHLENSISIDNSSWIFDQSIKEPVYLVGQPSQRVTQFPSLSLSKAREQMFFTAFPIALALLHFLLFVFYPRAKENLYYSFFVIFMAGTSYINYLPETLENFIALRIIMLVMNIFGLLFAYSLLYTKLPKQIYLFISTSSVLFVWILINPKSALSSLFFVYIIVFLIEFVRIVIKAIIKKISGIWILGVGTFIVCSVSIYEALMDIFGFRALFGVEDPGVYGSLVLLISMSVYLAFKFARTNTSLEKRSHELQQLNVELEDRVTQRTGELAKANKVLEKQNLDISDSRNKIQVAHIELLKAHDELNQTQARLVQSEKMASLGTMAAGVAHEINTPVGAVSSASDTSRRSIDKVINTIENSQTLEDIRKDSKFKQALEILKSSNSVIVMASERITKIIRRLKNFARLDEAEFQEADIHEGLESTLTLLNHKIKDRVDVVKDYGSIPKIQCYPNRLNQVFMNVLNNASQAIHDKGTIAIKTSIEEGKVNIRIIDDGEGIKKENLKKIFDPGFTTRGVGVGTGLGLSISYNIIKDHNGEIKVKSDVGKGTEVLIIVPIKQGKLPAQVSEN